MASLKIGCLGPSLAQAGLLVISDTHSSAIPSPQNSTGDRLSALSFAWLSAARTVKALILGSCPSTISGRMLSPVSPGWLSPNTLELVSFTQWV
jgi:hypothetical protein